MFGIFYFKLVFTSSFNLKFIVLNDYFLFIRVPIMNVPLLKIESLSVILSCFTEPYLNF